MLTVLTRTFVLTEHSSIENIWCLCHKQCSLSEKRRYTQQCVGSVNNHQPTRSRVCFPDRTVIVFETLREFTHSLKSNLGCDIDQTFRTPASNREEPGFNPSIIGAEVMLQTVALGQVFLRTLPSSAVSIGLPRLNDLSPKLCTLTKRHNP